MILFITYGIGRISHARIAHIHVHFLMVEHIRWDRNKVDLFLFFFFVTCIIWLNLGVISFKIDRFRIKNLKPTMLESAFDF